MLAGGIMTESEAQRQIEERLVAIEEWMMHTDRLLSNLNDVVCALHDRLDEQQRRLEQLHAAQQRLALPDEQRSFEDERPPHY